MPSPKNYGIYTNKELLNKVKRLGHYAYINKQGQLVTKAGTPLVYDYTDNTFYFKNSAGKPFLFKKNGKLGLVPEGSKRNALKAGLNYPAIYQTILEDQQFVKSRVSINRSKRVPFMGNKKTTVSSGKSKGAPISTNLIDSINANLKNPADRKKFIGISSRETDFGKWPAYSIVRDYNNVNNRSVFQRTGSVSPSDIANNHSYYVSPSRGTLNIIFKQKGSQNPFIIGTPGAHYNNSNYINTLGTRSEWLDKQESNVRYQRSAGTFDPSKKRMDRNKSGVVTDYYNPEPNPYQHAVDYFNDMKYGMGQDYVNRVNKDAQDVQYLLKKNGGYLSIKSKKNLLTRL